MLALSLLGLTACVIGRASRPTSSESAQGPSAPFVMGGPVVPHTAPEAENDSPSPAEPGKVWAPGYWHWDGVRYVWQRGHWEPTKP